MLIETTHDIPDEQAFRSALAGQSGFPEGVRLLASLVRRDHSHLTAVWEAPSADAVRTFLDGKIGKAAQSAYHELDESATTGLAQPQPQGAVSRNPMLLHELGKELARMGRGHEAMAIFQLNAEQNPNAWFTVAGLARGYAALGERARALETMRAALQKAPAHRRDHVQGLLNRLESGQSLN